MFCKDYWRKKMNNIEKDIETLEKMLETLEELFQLTKINNTKERNALRNLLTDYKKQKEEIKKWKQMYLKEVDKKVDIMLLYNKLLKENRENKKKYIALLLEHFSENTKTYQKYKKELDKLLEESEDRK